MHGILLDIGAFGFHAKIPGQLKKRLECQGKNDGFALLWLHQDKIDGFALLWLHLLKAKQFILCVRQAHIPTLATVCKTLETENW